MAAKSIRKSVSFDDGDGDRTLLDAIATHQSNHEQSFSDLCKQALRQYLLSKEPTQPVVLFMELQHQIAQLTVRVATLEDNTSITSALHQTDASSAEPLPSVPQLSDSDQGVTHEDTEPDDPVLARLGPLLDDF